MIKYFSILQGAIQSSDRSIRRKKSDPSVLEQACSSQHSTQDLADNTECLLSPLPPPGKGRCWCCWEVTETADNPLIRVCRGCKDLDLQWIHQVCVDSYLTALPPSHGTHGQQPVLPDPHREQQQPLLGAQPANSNGIPNDRAVGDDEADDQRNHHVDVGLLKSKAFKCTRCGDPYKVVEDPIPRIQVIAGDKNLRASVLVMVVCMAVITACSVSIIQESWGSDKMMIDFQCCREVVNIRVSMVAFSGFILCLSYWFGFETMMMIWAFSGGRATRRVLGLS
ncbi:hypothetical protein HDU81_010433 [Chytriomyces hyalinus]|nr:hypothetical protein HDU81_010433 [Chytriomyces hyalinus]